MENRKSSILKERISVVSKYEAFYTGGGVQVTQDGCFMLCCFGDSIKVVDIASGKTETTIGGKENDEVTSFLLADDDETLMVAAKNGILVQWDFKERTKIKTWKSVHTGPVSCMAFDSSCSLLATGGSDSTIKVWDIVGKYYTHNFKGAQGVFSVVCFYQNDSGLFVVGAANDYKIRVWSLDTSQCVAALEGHYSTVTSLQFCQSKNTMISGGRDKVVLLWNLHDFSLSKTIPVYESIESVVLIPEERTLLQLHIKNDGISFVTAGSKGVLKVWDSVTGRCVHSQDDTMTSLSQDEEENEQNVTTQAFYNKALDAISIVTYEHNILMYKLEDFSLIKQFVGYNDEVLDIKFMGSKETHLAVATNSPLIRIYEISTFACQLLEGHTDIVVSLDVFPKDKNMMISGAKDNSILVWQMNPESGKVDYIYMAYGHTRNVSAVACCWNEPRFFLSASDDTTIKVWNIPRKKPVIALKVHLEVRCTVKAHDKTINSICVSVNDELVATGSQDRTAKLWSTKDLTCRGTFKGHKKGVMCVEFSPVDLCLATASKDGHIKLWSVTEFICLKTFEGHFCAIQNVMFVSEGMQLLSSSCNGIVKLWSIKRNEYIQTEAEHTGVVWALTANAKEDIIVTGGADSNIIIWKDVTEEKRAEQFEKHKNEILHEQQLLNMLQEKKWVEALGLALVLEQPFRSLKVVHAILRQLDGSGRTLLHNTVAKLRGDQIENLLKYVVEWNTTSKHCQPATLIMLSLLRLKTPEELKEMKGFREIVRSLIPYADRHDTRISRLYEDFSGVINLIQKNAGNR